MENTILELAQTVQKVGISMIEKANGITILLNEVSNTFREVIISIMDDDVKKIIKDDNLERAYSIKEALEKMLVLSQDNPEQKKEIERILCIINDYLQNKMVQQYYLFIH